MCKKHCYYCLYVGLPPRSSYLPEHIEESYSPSDSSSKNHGDHGIYATIANSTPLTHPYTRHNCHQSNQHNQGHQKHAQQHPSVTLKQRFRLVCLPQLKTISFFCSNITTPPKKKKEAN